jgi:hypothetical protein
LAEEFCNVVRFIGVQLLFDGFFSLELYPISLLSATFPTTSTTSMLFLSLPQGFRVYPKSAYCLQENELGECFDLDAKDVFAVNSKALWGLHGGTTTVNGGGI